MPRFLRKGPAYSLSHVGLFASLWTLACKAPQCMGFSRQEYWTGLPIPPPGDLHDPGIQPVSPALQADSLPSALPGKPILLRLVWEKERETKTEKGEKDERFEEKKV